MSDTPVLYHVAGIGNAIVDVIAKVDDRFLERHDIHKGTMTLVDQERSRAIYGAMPEGTLAAGGSVANTLAGIASFGGKAAFIGRMRDDDLGRFFEKDNNALDIHMGTPPVSDGGDTSRSMILVTPDGQRSMNTYLGASVDLKATDLDPAVIEAAQILYLEGYLWDSDAPREALAVATDVAREAGRQVAFTLSDPFVADRHREAIRAFLPGKVDILFANEAEITSLYEANTLEEAITHVGKDVPLSVVTRSELGAVVVTQGGVEAIEAVPVAKVEDTTGAGDQFAAGFLYGLTHGHTAVQSAHLGAVAAAEVISHIGPRPHVSLKTLIPADW